MKIGPWALGDIASGKYKKMTPSARDIEALFPH
jgi:hypothetical protein